MPTATQLNLPLDNEIGTLARLCRDLAHGGVNLLAIAAPETGREKGGVRLLVLNREVAVRALSKAGYLFTEEQVLFLEMTNRPGALAKAIDERIKPLEQQAVTKQTVDGMKKVLYGFGLAVLLSFGIALFNLITKT